MLASTKPNKVKLYRHPGQVTSSLTVRRILFDFEKMGVKCLSIEDDIVKGWCRNPATYPQEFRDKVLYLGGKTEVRGGCESVPCLTWFPGLVSEKWLPLDTKIGDTFVVARLASF
ncbi:MAG: hypothetical protein Q7R69_00020 [bacterium]|nr:hypothetical protein [bacterium]